MVSGYNTPIHAIIVFKITIIMVISILSQLWDKLFSIVIIFNSLLFICINVFRLIYFIYY